MGNISQSDVERADVAGDAIILGFNVDLGEEYTVCCVCVDFASQCGVVCWVVCVVVC